MREATKGGNENRTSVTAPRRGNYNSDVTVLRVNMKKIAEAFKYYGERCERNFD